MSYWLLCDMCVASYDIYLYIIYNSCLHVSIVESSWLLPMAGCQVGISNYHDILLWSAFIKIAPALCVSYHGHMAGWKTMWFVGTMHLWDNVVWLFAVESNIVGFMVYMTSKLLAYGTKMLFTRSCTCIALHYYNRHTKSLKSFK